MKVEPFEWVCLVALSLTGPAGLALLIATYGAPILAGVVYGAIVIATFGWILWLTSRY